MEQKLLHGKPAVARFLPEAGMVIMVGMVAGGIFKLVAISDHMVVAGDVAEFIMSFDSSIFFIVLLPPVIFSSGYHLHRELFLRFFNPICLFAFGGTMISMSVVAGLLYLVCQGLAFSPTLNELLAFGALM